MFRRSIIQSITHSNACLKKVFVYAASKLEPTFLHIKYDSTYNSKLKFFSSNLISQYSRLFDTSNFGVKCHVTPNYNTLKFVTEKKILPFGSSIEFTDANSAQKSSLGKRLFFEGVTRVFIGHDFVSVEKNNEANWPELKDKILNELDEFLISNEDASMEQSNFNSNTEILPDDSETVAMIKEIIETRIRRNLQEDGGDIAFLGFEDGIVFVQLQGACSGCSMSSETLKVGIERMLMHWIAEVNGVVPVSSYEEFENLTKK